MVKAARPVTIGDQIAELRERLDQLERKPGPRGSVVPTNLGQLKDCRVLYRKADEKPTAGQALAFHADPTIPVFGGWWEPSGGALIAGIETLSITSDGTDAGATVLLVPPEWDETQGCTGVVSVGFTSMPPFVENDGDYDGDPFNLMLQVVPWDIAAGPPSALTFSETDVFPASNVIGLGGFATTILSVPAVLRSGKPHAFVFVRTPPGVGALDFEVRWLIRPDGPL